MAIKLSDLKKNVRTVVVSYMGETFNVSYRPAAITPALGQEMDAPATRSPLVLALSQALVGWDVIDDDTDKPVPITAENLAGFGAGLLNAILRDISTDMLVGKAPGATSAAG
jgi:hypothetical protein